jgi:hypothetical protein
VERFHVSVLHRACFQQSGYLSEQEPLALDQAGFVRPCLLFLFNDQARQTGNVACGRHNSVLVVLKVVSLVFADRTAVDPVVAGRVHLVLEHILTQLAGEVFRRLGYAKFWQSQTVGHRFTLLRFTSGSTG